MSKSRRRFTSELKAQVVRRHLSGKEPVSDLADRFGIQPSQIPTWVKQVLDQADKAFERSSGGRRTEDSNREKIERLEQKLATKNEVISELMEENVKAKKANGELYQWGTLKGCWVPHDTRDAIVDDIKHWTDRTELPAKQLLCWLGLSPSKYHQWKDRHGKVNAHNGQVPRDWWLEAWEKQAIFDYHDKHPLEVDIETILQRAVEKHPGVTRRIISDNGPQFIARDFKHYNQVRLHSAVGYITPAAKLRGLEHVIFAERDRKLEDARRRRRTTSQVA